jgi:hypothetical protein
MQIIEEPFFRRCGSSRALAERIANYFGETRQKSRDTRTEA